MELTWSDVVSWLIVGALVGLLLGLVRRGKKGASTRLRNLGVGLVGAVIGGVLFALLGIDLGLGSVKVTLESLLSALVGSIVFLLLLWIFRKKASAA